MYTFLLVECGYNIRNYSVQEHCPGIRTCWRAQLCIQYNI
jgi:hypothetical protein